HAALLPPRVVRHRGDAEFSLHIRRREAVLLSGRQHLRALGLRVGVALPTLGHDEPSVSRVEPNCPHRSRARGVAPSLEGEYFKSRDIGGSIADSGRLTSI